MSVKVRWWDASLAFWILAKVTTRFIKSLHFLNIIFAKLPGRKLTGPGEFIFFYISPLKSLNLALIPGAKFDAHRGTWTGCIYFRVLGENFDFQLSGSYVVRYCKILSNVFDTTIKTKLWLLLNYLNYPKGLEKN